MKHLTNIRVSLFLLLALSSSVLFAQMGFNIEAFSDSTKYGWKNYIDRNEYRNDLVNRQNMLQLYELEAQSINANLAKSAVIPGWGQFSTKANNKATVFLGIELVAAIGAIYFYDQAQTNHRLYQSATQIDEINNYYGKAQTPYQYSLMMIGLASLVWGYNLYDVVVSTNEYNAALWQDIVKRRNESPVQITPNGVEIRF